MAIVDFGISDVVCYDLSKDSSSSKIVTDAQKKSASQIFATRDSRELSKISGRRAIIITNVRDPKDAKLMRMTADFIIYEITPKTTEKELRRIIDNKLCDMLLGVEQLFSQPGLHFQKILFNQVIATVCAQQHIVILLNLRTLLFSDEKMNQSVANVSLASERIRFVTTLCEKYQTPYLGVTLAENKFESRNPRDLNALVTSLANYVMPKSE